VAKRILVVEDSQAMRAFVRAAIEDVLPDCDVVEGRTGFEALRILPQGPFDLVVTDINMPDINGLELIRFVRERDAASGRRTPIVVISTESSSKDRERGMTLGADDYVTKPFSPEELQAIVRRLVGPEGAA
jgi:two-component system chemotaxis response regulator CheY